MAVLARLEKYLKENNTGFETFDHPEAYTAQEVAAEMHVPGRELAKVVMLRGAEKFFMAVLPASRRVDLSRVKKVLGEKDLRLSTEEEFKVLFPDCEPGAEPPFGNLYNIDTLVDKTLAEDEQIFFNAGTHKRAVKMNYKDYAALVKPEVADFAE
jgi:Ala-tRNA(Pro) deacylase